MFRIRKQFKFEMAHQLSHAYSACCSDTIHGHSYLLEVFFKGPLDDTGMVIDFGEVSKEFKRYIDDEWDHALVMPADMDQEYIDVLNKYNKKLRLVSYNPTAERMAEDIYKVFECILEGINKDHLLERVRIHETATGWAEYKDDSTCSNICTGDN